VLSKGACGLAADVFGFAPERAMRSCWSGGAASAGRTACSAGVSITKRVILPTDATIATSTDDRHGSERRALDGEAQEDAKHFPVVLADGLAAFLPAMLIEPNARHTTMS
jgi:hypothetical protein